MVIHRREDWPLRLSRFLQSRARRPFAWGEQDCLLLAADAMEALTGFDPAAAWRGYKKEKEAQALLNAHGGVCGLISEGLGRPPQHNLRLARRGDVVAFLHGGRMAAGIVDDSGLRIAAAGKTRLTRLPLKLAFACWSY